VWDNHHYVHTTTHPTNKHAETIATNQATNNNAIMVIKQAVLIVLLGMDGNVRMKSGRLLFVC
jgi:hypothetical protein